MAKFNLIRPHTTDFTYLVTFFQALEHNTKLQRIDIFDPCLDYKGCLPQDIQQSIIESFNYN
jgi:hypothetical protein